MRLLSSVFLLALCASTAAAYRGQPPAGRAGEPPDGRTCAACHSDFALNSGDVTLGLIDEATGRAFTSYEPGIAYERHHWSRRVGQLGAGCKRHCATHGAKPGGLQQRARLIALPHLAQQDAVCARVGGGQRISRQDISRSLDNCAGPPFRLRGELVM